MKKLTVLLTMILTLGFTAIGHAGNGPYDGVWELNEKFNGVISDQFLIEEYEGRMAVIHIAEYIDDLPDWTLFYAQRQDSRFTSRALYGWNYKWDDFSLKINFMSSTKAKMFVHWDDGFKDSFMLTKKDCQPKDVYDGIWSLYCPEYNEVAFAYIYELSGKTHIVYLDIGWAYIWIEFCGTFTNGHCGYLQNLSGPNAECGAGVSFYTEYSGQLRVVSKAGEANPGCHSVIWMDKILY